jgi:hypothetical protein
MRGLPVRRLPRDQFRLEYGLEPADIAFINADLKKPYFRRPRQRLQPVMVGFAI